MKRTWIIISLVMVGFGLLALPRPARANQLAQVVYQTPTAGADGRIIYIVKNGDTCLRISLLANVSLDQIRKFNNLKVDCVVYPGMQLLIGLAGPAEASPTPGPSPTPTSLLPTPTPFNGTGEVCVVLFDDANGDAVRQDSESVLADGAISFTDRTGKFSQTGKTSAGTDRVCFKDVPEGAYNVSVAVPNGYNPTTVMNYALSVKAGDQAILDFGAQINSKSAPLPPTEGGRSPILGLVGGTLLLAGAGLGIYVWRSRK